MSRYREALDHIINCDRDDGGVSNLSDAYRNDIGALMELVREHEETEKKATCESNLDYAEAFHEAQKMNYEMAKIVAE